MIVDPSNTKRAQNSNPDPGNDQLRLDPGIPQRKPRSAGKLCLWLFAVVIVLVGGIALYLFFSTVFHSIRHPHKGLYHDTPEDKVEDWSQVVRPMIRKDSKFDVVASVWIRDEDGKDAVISVDGEERPERLIFTDTVFRGVDMKSKIAFANVTLRVPTSYFKQANLSNYDLRASFVLAQPSPNRPSWLNFVKNYTSWKPQGFKTPSVRKPDLEPTLEDQIYDSFGISIPLIEFYNITSKGSGAANATEIVDSPNFEDTQLDSDDESDWDEETTESRTETSTSLNTTKGWKRNTFLLEFTGDKHPVTEYHPYIVTRTHLRIVKQDKLYKRSPYTKAQKELANKTCANGAREPIKDPEWYQCHRDYRDSGIFETKVQLRLPSEDEEGKKESKKSRTEWLYAPFLSAMPRAAGPKELVPVPVERSASTQLETPQSLTPDEEHVTVTWRLSFSSHAHESLSIFDGISIGAAIGVGNIYNMTEPDNKLEHVQHNHDINAGLFGHRIDEDAHPRRIYVFGFTSIIIMIICWFLTIHYWYTLTSTTGISRLGTVFLALWYFVDATETMLVTVLHPENKYHWLTHFPITYIFYLIPPFIMLIAVLRIEFSWSAKAKRGARRGDEKEKKGWIPKVYLAKATHSERLSERIEAKVSRKTKLLLFIAFFAATHFFATPKSYILSPRIPVPSEPHPLEPLSRHVPTIVKYANTLRESSHMTGSVLQFIMNAYSRTYAGSYKSTTVLMLIVQVVMFLDALPSIVGKTVRAHGISVDEVVVLVIAIVDFAQALKYRSVKNSDAEDVE